MYERNSVSWNVLRLAQKEKTIYFYETANKSQRREIRDICADLCNAVKRMEAVDLRQNKKLKLSYCTLRENLCIIVKR